MSKFKSSRFGLLLLVGAVAAFAVLPALALAQNPINDPSAAQYNPPVLGEVEGGSGSGGANDAAADPPAASGQPTGLNANVGSLPFTGVDLIILAGVALVLTGTGFALRRVSAPRGPGV